MRSVPFEVSSFILLILVTLAAPTHASGIDPATENSLLRGDWEIVLESLTGDSLVNNDPVARHLIAHAYTATNRGFRADSLLNSMSYRDRQIWSEWVDTLLEYNPVNPVAIYLSADIKTRTGLWAEGVADCARAINALNKDIALLFKARGAAWAERNRDSAAIADFTKALQINADDPATYYKRGKSYMNRGMADEAIADFDEVLRTHPGFRVLRYHKAQALDKAGRFDEAMAAYEHFIGRAVEADSELVVAAEARILEVEEEKAVADSAALAAEADSTTTEDSTSVERTEAQARIDSVAAHLRDSIRLADGGEPLDTAELALDSSIVAQADSLAADSSIVDSSLAMVDSLQVPDSSQAEADTTVAETPPKRTAPAGIEQLPVPTHIPEAGFPQAARESGASGTVTVKVFVDRDGSARDVAIEKESGTQVGFEESASRAVKKSQWKPATSKGRPVPYWISFDVEFTSDGRAINHIEMAEEVAESYPSPDDSVEVDRIPFLITVPDPEYPEEAGREGIAGEVVVKVLVDKDGRARDVVIETGSGQEVGFEQAALKAAREGVWSPAVRDGEPIPYWISHTFKFKAP